jgi:hypothetical protein
MTEQQQADARARLDAGPPEDADLEQILDDVTEWSIGGDETATEVRGPLFAFRDDYLKPLLQDHRAALDALDRVEALQECFHYRYERSRRFFRRVSRRPRRREVK